ncbi:hypothetical protein [Paracraurococcus ruber]|uniref:Type II toxin-antitoxin system HicA family toxin n=1 Tax=Paracraurococcus ruber TaxID=77675 RepID=A0ABS1D4Z9_9PROT|nr:hypothetical protein [Paracraurococcus ruber]MBK1661928.1 hypothetical protein [Paracraurococcus ruber]TDG20103.1 hypothetical protein E2C05_27260 [Paracraurococcus ruber]
MNHRHRKVLHALFAHPVSANLDPKHVVAALEEIGADITRGGHGQIVVRLGGYMHGFHDDRHSLSKEEVGTLRKLLASAGVDPVRDWPI